MVASDFICSINSIANVKNPIVTAVQLQLLLFVTFLFRQRYHGHVAEACLAGLHSSTLGKIEQFHTTALLCFSNVWA